MTPTSKCCPCCHGQNITFLFNLNYGDVCQCINCKTAFTVFHGSETLDESNEVFKTNDFIKARLYDQYRLRKVARKRLNLLTKFVNHGSILEFGSCTGEFLYEAGRKGYDVYSVDKYDSVLNINKTDKLKNVVTADACLYKDDKTYDAIVAFHVIEHLTNPGEFLARCHNILKPGGVIFLELPNFGRLSRKLLGRKSAIFHDHHACHFDKYSLECLLRNHDYQPVFAKTIDETVRFVIPLYNPTRNAIWKTIKKIMNKKNIPVNLKVNYDVQIIKEEKEIMNSVKAKIYRIESGFINGLSMLLSPLSLLLNTISIGSCLQVIARKGYEQASD